MANPARKTKKTITKRFRVTKRGKVIRRKMASGHFRAKKSSSTKQGLRNTTKLKGADRRALRQEGMSLVS